MLYILLVNLFMSFYNLYCTHLIVNDFTCCKQFMHLISTFTGLKLIAMFRLILTLLLMDWFLSPWCRRSTASASCCALPWIYLIVRVVFPMLENRGAPHWKKMVSLFCLSSGNVPITLLACIKLKYCIWASICLYLQQVLYDIHAIDII